jgi:hypothetical protein
VAVRAAVMSAALSAALSAVLPAELAAQRGPARALPQAAPSRADSLLARGRLWAAEEALYKAVDAAPRAPAARGELGRYLASRAVHDRRRCPRALRSAPTPRASRRR